MAIQNPTLGLLESTSTRHIPRVARMSFERPLGADCACRSDDRPTGQSRRRAEADRSRRAAVARERRGRDGPDARDRLEPRRRADRARPAPRDGRGRACRPRRPAGADARARRPDRRDRARGQRRLPGRLRRGSDRHDPLRAPRPHGQPALVAAARPEPAWRGWRSEALAAVADDGPRPGGCRGCAARPRRGADRHLLWAPNLGWSEIPVADEIAAPASRVSTGARRQRGEPRRARRALAGRRARPRELRLRLRRGRRRRRHLRRRRALPRRARLRRRVRPRHRRSRPARRASAAPPAASRRSSGRRRSRAGPGIDVRLRRPHAQPHARSSCGAPRRATRRCSTSLAEAGRYLGLGARARP